MRSKMKRAEGKYAVCGRLCCKMRKVFVGVEAVVENCKLRQFVL
jgi:hypothetical protein